MVERLYRGSPAHQAERTATEKNPRIFPTGKGKSPAPGVESADGLRRPQRSGPVYRHLHRRLGLAWGEDGVSRWRLLAGRRGRRGVGRIENRTYPLARRREPYVRCRDNARYPPPLPRAGGVPRGVGGGFDKKPPLQPD